MDNGYTYISTDLTDEKEVQEVIKKSNPEEVIHCAAITRVDDCELYKR